LRQTETAKKPFGRPRCSRAIEPIPSHGRSAAHKILPLPRSGRRGFADGNSDYRSASVSCVVGARPAPPERAGRGGAAHRCRGGAWRLRRSQGSPRSERLRP
jgi:hypothetical protein